MRGVLRQFLVCGVVSVLLLPVTLGVVLGLGALLASLGDDAGAVACNRAALVIGIIWIVSVVATAVTSSIIVLESSDREPQGCRLSTDLQGHDSGAGDRRD